MKLSCDFCGAIINTEKDTVCPNCGGSYANDNELKRELKREERHKDLSLEEKEIELESKRIHNEKQRQSIRNKSTGYKSIKALLCIIFGPWAIGALLTILIVVAGVILAIYSAITGKDIVPSTSNNESVYEEDYEYEDYINNSKHSQSLAEEVVIEEIPVEVNFGETGSTSTYSVTITKATQINGWPWKPNAGYIYADFYFIVENISDKEIFSDEKVTFLVDGILLDRFNYSDSKQLKDSKIPVATKIDGWCSVEIPLDAKEITVKYGEYITIKVPMENITLIEE